MSLVGILNRLFSHREIVNCDRNIYLHRWYVIRTAPLAVFIHKFIRSDEDRALHDHPWNFLVIPIWRGYWEHREESCGECDGYGVYGLFSTHVCQVCHGAMKVTHRRRVLPILGARFRRGTYKHRVELLPCPLAGDPRYSKSSYCPNDCNVDTWELPSWSIFIRFREFRDWGFHMPEGWIQWNKFWQDKCE